MLLTEGSGIPLGFCLASANRGEVTLACETLDSVRVRRLVGRPRHRARWLVADRGYDSREFRRAVRRRGMRVCIPEQRRPAHWRPKRGRPIRVPQDRYGLRWKVERSFAWLGNFRRLLVRHDRLIACYQGFFTFALLTVCLRRLLK
jgi:transposase